MIKKQNNNNDKLSALYFKNKCDGYKEQDKKAGRTIGENYINITWLDKCMNKCCGGCGCNFSIDIDDNHNVTSDITAQRLDNSLPHTIDNIIPMCVNWNFSRKSKYQHNYYE
jgi:hypothetical protein